MNSGLTRWNELKDVKRNSEDSTTQWSMQNRVELVAWTQETPGLCLAGCSHQGAPDHCKYGHSVCSHYMSVIFGDYKC